MRKGTLGPLLKGMAFAVVTAMATALLAITIANRGGGDAATYRARFSDATSVNPGDDIRMSGVRIGQVERVSLVERRLVEVEFSVDRARRLSASVTATIKFRNLIGQRYISLDQGTGEGALAPGGVIPLERTRPALDLTAMLGGFKPLFQALSPKDVNQLAFEIVQVLQGEGGTVDSLLRHTASLTSTLAQKDQVIGQVITNLNTVLQQVNERGDKLSTLVTTTQELVSGLARDATPIGEAIEGLAALTTSTADLLRDGREPLRKDIDALGALSKNLADGTPAFESFIANLPRKYENLGRVLSYGTWLNVFICSVTADIPPAPGGPPPGIPLTESRCLR